MQWPRMDMAKVGRGVFLGGTATLPLGVGVIAGYWIADAGVRWSSVVGLLLVVWILGMAAMAAGSHLLHRGGDTGARPGETRIRRRVVVFAALAVALAGLRLGVYVLQRPSALTRLDPVAFAKAFESDGRQYRELDAELRRVLAALSSHAGLFDAAAPRVLTADEERLVLDGWSTFVNTAFALDQIRRFWEDYYRLDLSRVERDRHLRAFLLTFAAELSLFENTSRLVGFLDRNPNVVKYLDLPRPERHLPANGVAIVREELAGLTDLSRVSAGKSYRRYLDELHGASRDAVTGGFDWLWRDVDAHLAALERIRPELASAVTNDFAPLERGLKRFTLPVIAGVAEWMGDTRVKRIGRYLIAPDQLATVRATLQPGDVLLVRKNWYLSNIGLPGFWPHAEIWLGDDARLAATFDADPDVKTWVARTAGRDVPFSTWLQDRFPDAAKARAAAGTGDHALLVIEAISEGVSLTSLDHAAGDYLVALRPRLPLWVKAQALARALEYLERPYDFDFDFATDHALVCTELVWRSYRPLGDAPGLSLPLVTVLGRETLPANEIARLFRDERARPDPQFDFVLYYEGREHHTDAVVATEAAFLTTPDRSKWDFGQP